VVRPDARETRLRTAPIYYLTSRRTGSAAEHMALALKRTGRATLIGEPTAGANHFGLLKPFGRFAAFVPFGRTYDPDTGRDWEGAGVAPDVRVHPDQALDEALKRAAAAGAHPA
jgi:C-terminal processing protease CtpA/Prc